MSELQAAGRKEAIAYVDVSKTGFQVLAEAVLVRWSVDGIKPDPDRDGPEVVELAREIYASRLRRPAESQS